MGKRLWAYWKSSASSGAVQYLYLDYVDGWKLSPLLEIQPGDAGTGIGNGIMKAIFNEDDLLPMRIISPASPTNDLPYLDTPWNW